MPHRKIISPFKFLDSYKKDDFQSYFGRDKESVDLFELYKDSSIMILHGPSGSGKTSLIYCGLLNRIKREKKVLSIRRGDNLIKAIKKRLFINQNAENKTINDQTKLVDDFFLAQSNLNKVLVSIKHIEGMMLSVEEKIIWLKRKNKAIPTSTQSSSNSSIDNQTDALELITKYKERLQKFSAERIDLLEQLREDNKEVNTISNNIYDYFMDNRIKNSHTPFTPLIIFDQFEELFVYGTKEEINTFGLFLKLIFEYQIPFNIIISLREEYFGHLDQLQSYVPHIFYKKIRLAHPNKGVIKNIIEKSFQEFNINQYRDHTKEKLSDTEKENRIELILNQIKIKDNESSTSYHLPFLQVYLDSLYKVDYYRTYGEKSSQNNYEYLPLEFKEEEIKEFGSIEHVLENYIREVNNKIIRNPSNKLNDRIKHKDSVIKFLRHFTTKDDLKRRMPIQVEKDNYYVINNRKFLDKIQKDIWGKTNDLEYNETISEIINKLKDKGILKVSTDQNLGADYAELSHDIIAKIISKIRTEDDFMLLIKKDFISSFDIYEDTKNKGDLLSIKQIERMDQYMEYIMNDDNEDRLLLKKQFIKESIQETQKEELEKKKLKKKLKRFVYYPFIMTCLLFILVALSYSLLKSGLENNIKELLSYALQDYNVDKTSSFNYIRKSEKISNLKLFGYKLFDLNYDLLDDFKNDLYRDYKRTPFYHNNISFGNDFKIKETKTRVSSINDSLLYLFALSESNDFIIKPVLYTEKNTKSDSIIFEAKNVLAFEPFIPNKNKETENIANHKLISLIAQKDKDSVEIELKLINYSIKTDSISLQGNLNYGDLIYIEHRNAYSFIIGINNKLLELEIDPNSKEYKTKLIVTLDDEIRRIKTFKEGEHYLVLYGENKVYTSLYPKNFNILEKDKLDQKDRIHTFKKIKGKDTVLLGLKGRIKILELNASFQTYNHFVQDEEINTIDLNKNEELLVSSHDNGANLWNSDNTILRKQFIGHIKPIKNVSFVNDSENYIITSSEETVKIWNITPISKTLNSYEFPSKISKDTSVINTKNIFLYEDMDKQTKNIIYKHTNNMNDISYSSNDTYIVSGGSDNTALIWKNQKKSKYCFIQTLTPHTNDIKDVEFYKDTLLLTASSDHTVQIYHRKKNEDDFIQLPSLIRHDYRITSSTFSKDGKSIISKDEKGHIKKWDFRSFDEKINERTMDQEKNIKKQNDNFTQTIISWLFKLQYEAQ